MLVRDGGLVRDVVQGQGAQVDGVQRDLPEANLAYALRRPVAPDLTLDHLAQVGVLVAHQYVSRADVADHARDADVRWRGQHIAREHVDKLLSVVGAPCAPLEETDQPRACDQRAGIELDLVGKEAGVAHEGAEVLLVGLRCGAQQVHHQVGVYLEAKEANEREGPPDLFDACPASVGVQGLLAGGLDAHLDLGAAQLPKQRE